MPTAKFVLVQIINKGLTPVAHLAYMTPFHSPSIEQKDFLSLGALQEKEQRNVVYFVNKTRPLIHLTFKLKFKLHYIFHLQYLSSYPVLFSSIEGFGVEHDVSTVAWLRAGDVALPTKLHPWHSQNRPGQTGSGQWNKRYLPDSEDKHR